MCGGEKVQRMRPACMHEAFEQWCAEHELKPVVALGRAEMSDLQKTRI
jgi:hypothetical protein